MDISRREIKALASDTRVMMLKSLAGRRKMPSELSREFSMAPSTIVEHLHVLERSGLIKKIETGHKWKYYELTDKGKNLVRPKFPVQFAVMLSLGVIMVFGSFAGILATGIVDMRQAYEAGAPAPVYGACETAKALETVKALAPQVNSLVDPWHGIILLVGIVGFALVLVAVGAWLWSKWK